MTRAPQANPEVRVRILAVAYACEPEKGSEPGAGWTWARMLAHIGETWVITRANNRPLIEGGLAAIPERDRLHFIYVDLPAWARFWKRGERGLRPYYLLWQVVAFRRARALHRHVGFDTVWHLTLANAWLGSLAPSVGPPSVYGPVGGGVGTPWRLLPTFGIRGVTYELARAAARTVGRYLNPIARLAWRKADLILVQNPETADWLPKRHRAKATVFANPVVNEIDFGVRRPRRSPTALFAGRLLPWKGAALALRAMKFLPQWDLVVCGSGPEEPRLRRLAGRLGIETRVDFRGVVPRDELLRLMREEADVFLFPSLHDEAGWVIAEALSRGLPIVCLERGGPPVLAGSAALTAPLTGSPTDVASSLGRLLSRGTLAARDTIEERAREFLFDQRVESLRLLLSACGLAPLEPACAVPGDVPTGPSARLPAAD